MQPPLARAHALLLTPALLLSLAACGGGGGSAEDAKKAFERSVGALEDGELSTYVTTALPKVQVEQMKASWEEQRKQKPSPEEAAQFKEVMTMLTAKDAEKQLFDKIAPQLGMIEQQAASFAAMLPTLASGMGGDQAAPAVDTLTALGNKLPEVGLGDQDKLRKAISVATATARKLGLKDIEGLMALDFDGMLSKVDVLYAGVADLLDVYGLSLEESLESTEVAVQSETENQVVLNVSYSIFGGPRQTQNVEMALVDGRWVTTGR